MENDSETKKYLEEARAKTEQLKTTVSNLQNELSEKNEGMHELQSLLETQKCENEQFQAKIQEMTVSTAIYVCLPINFFLVLFF